MRAEFDLRQATGLAKYPWVIRSGQCLETSAFDVAPRSVRLIEGAEDRTARLTTTVAVRLTPGESYHVAIAADRKEPDLFIACGPLLPVS